MYRAVIYNSYINIYFEVRIYSINYNLKTTYQNYFFKIFLIPDVYYYGGCFPSFLVV